MRRERSLITPRDAAISTHTQIRRYKSYQDIARKLYADTDHTDRLKACMCKMCFYHKSMRIAGQAFTFVKCGICATDMTFSSTHTHALCEGCARAYELCKECGCDRELREERTEKDFTFSTVPNEEEKA
jgi:hypothetical protein